MKTTNHRLGLIHVLQMAYSGEKAAAYAYNAHWKSLKSEEERLAIQQIEQEELDHRQIALAMLRELNASPQAWRDVWMGIVGRTIGASCYVIGWFLPMYFAGRLEHSNVKEYEVAAAHADGIGMDEFASELRRLSDVELQHEQFFLKTITGHPLVPFMKAVFGWGPQRQNDTKQENAQPEVYPAGAVR